MIQPGKQFVENEICLLTISGAFQHNRIYHPQINETQREQFRKIIRRLLLEFKEQYNVPVSGSDHIENLRKFKIQLENQGKQFLNESRISFGTVQKLANLCLKYFWCLGLIKSEPPHCPIDRQILGKIGNHTSWTKMTEKDYCEIMEKIKSIAGKEGLAPWELRNFKRN